MVKQPWTTREKRIVESVYPDGGWQEVNKILPHRTQHGICQFARNHGVKMSADRKSEIAARCGMAGRGGIRWLPEHDDIVRRLYPDGGWQAVHVEMPNRSRQAICNRASTLNIKLSEERMQQVNWIRFRSERRPGL